MASGHSIVTQHRPSCSKTTDPDMALGGTQATHISTAPCGSRDLDIIMASGSGPDKGHLYVLWWDLRPVTSTLLPSAVGPQISIHMNLGLQYYLGPQYTPGIPRWPSKTEWTMEVFRGGPNQKIGYSLSRTFCGYPVAILSLCKPVAAAHHPTASTQQHFP